MVRARESLDSMIVDTESITKEYKEYMERIGQALERDCNQRKERAERESSQIIAQAKEEAEKTIAQARQEAKVKSELIIAEAKEEAEQIAKKSREEIAETQQESARVISETREKASQIIMELIECGTTQAQSEFSRAALEARSKTSRLLTEVSKNIEQIIGETETNIATGLERLSIVIGEARTKLQPLIEMRNKEAKVNSRQATGEAGIPTASVSEKTESAIPSVGDQQGAPIKESDDAKLFKGRLKLEIVPPFNQERLEGVPQWLARLTGLNIKSTSIYISENNWVTAYTIDLEQPMPLLKILKAVPQVKDAAERDGNIRITL
jgi:F0F1-type ATP synthase membrane subunit b/b'